MRKLDRNEALFKEEALELITGLETSLLDLERSPGDTELIGGVFRALHTIKGSGAMFGFDDISAFAHEVETVFDLVRNGKIAVTKELVDLALSARDHIRSMLDMIESEEQVDASATERLIGLFRKLIPGAEAAVETPVQAHVQGKEETKGKISLYRIRFRPSPDIFKKGTNPILLLNELRGLGECRVEAHTEGIRELKKHDPDECLTHWDILLTTDRGVNAIRDVFIFVEDDCELSIEDLFEGGSLGDGDYKRVGEILVERGDLTEDELEKALLSKRRIGDMLVEQGLLAREELDSALIEQKRAREALLSRQRAEAAASIRVPSERLDKLVNLIGELVTVQARLSQTVVTRGDAELELISEEVERLTDELRDSTMGIRMVPIGTTFSKFKRLVRDLSNELGKEVELKTEGAETELDKTVIEKLDDPLVHLIRNSIGHGIEPPSVREGAGKPAKGTVHLSAVHSGPHVFIRIKDDGAGLDAGAIRARAVERGLIGEDQELTDKELYSLILAPGFSTAKDVTSVSGRGVGLDVVTRSLDSLRGTVEIASEMGKGTEITLRLPLTLAIIDGLLVNIAEDQFILSLSSVEECVELSREDIRKAHGRNMAHVRGEMVPYIRLREQFDIPGEPPATEQVVITHQNGSRVGFAVDSVIGEHQTVIKSLGRFYRDIDGISGATILGDGKVALILDTEKLVRIAEMEQDEKALSAISLKGQREVRTDEISV
jgi:two-component system chemotaxis sensor kinase CheA